MIAVIKGDIVASRKLGNQALWLKPLKNLLASWGENHKNWELHSGDFFQIEIANPVEALQKMIEIKTVIKKVEPTNKTKKSSTIDVRLALGIGEKTYSGESISENNGPAYIYSSEKFDVLKKENVTIGIKTSWKMFDEEMNLYLKLTGILMDKWTVSSAELVQIVLNNPGITQEEIGKQIGIKQNSVSGRWNRANANEILEVEKMYRKKIESLLK
jgi:hypothetical protein